MSAIPFVLPYTIFVNHTCSVTNTKCILSIICHSLSKFLGMTLQFMSLTKWFFIQNSIIHDINSLHKCWDVEYTKLCLTNRHLGELIGSWDDNIYKHIHKKMTLESYHNDIKYHVTLNTIFFVLLGTTIVTRNKILLH